MPPKSSPEKKSVRKASLTRKLLKKRATERKKRILERKEAEKELKEGKTEYETKYKKYLAKKKYPALKDEKDEEEDEEKEYKKSPLKERPMLALDTVIYPRLERILEVVEITIREQIPISIRNRLIRCVKYIIEKYIIDTSPKLSDYVDITSAALILVWKANAMEEEFGFDLTPVYICSTGTTSTNRALCVKKVNKIEREMLRLNNYIICSFLSKETGIKKFKASFKRVISKLRSPRKK